MEPLQFWYLYPTKEVATIEFEKKWVPQFLPRNEYKNHPTYGWEEEYKNKYISAIHFNTGVSVYFKTYGQDVTDLQTGTVDAIFCDEELPEELYSELNMRISATDGYFHMVFTATLGQEIWRCTMEESGKDEQFKGALKLQISMYECLIYEDGTLSHWTVERIERVKNSCKSDAEIQRRVYGRFVIDGNLKYPAFSRARNINRDVKPPPDWYIFYSGTDIGSGGKEAHPAAITFVAVRPDFKYGRVFKGWRGDGITTTNGDILQKHTEMRGNLPIAAAYYDWQSKDFFVIAARIGEAFTPADKSHDVGESILNVLFKNKMLDIDDIPELKPLVTEIVTLKKDTPKTKAKDDFCDALRYNVTKIPWDFNAITGEKLDLGPLKPEMSAEERYRRGIDEQSLEDQLNQFDPDEELDAWDELMES
jgi:phage terminase large subunit-like protein